MYGVVDTSVNAKMNESWNGVADLLIQTFVWPFGLMKNSTIGSAVER